MKPLTATLLAASLLLNAALAYAALTAASSSDSASDSQLSALGSQPTSSRSPATPPLPDPQTWAKLQTDDLPTLVTHLRDAGFPKDVIRAMMSGLINEQFAARRRALDPDAANTAFWKNSSPDPKLQIAQSRLYYEQQKALRALLGEDARNDDPSYDAYQRNRFGNLSPDKLAAAQAISDDFNQKQTESYYRKGTISMSDRAAMERDQRTALAAVLSPAELEEYDLRTSNTGSSMRQELAAFNPSEAEFRALFKLRQPFDEKYNYTSGFMSQDQQRARQEAQKQLTADIAALLGPERAAEYTRTTDYSYLQTSQLIARLELPPETTVTLWNTQKEFEQRRNDLYRDTATLTPEARNQQLTALQQEAIAKITPLLGGNPSRVETYKQYGGQWLQGLVPRPRPPTP